MISRLSGLTIVLIFCFGCASERKSDFSKLSEIEKKSIHQFAERLTKTYNDFDHSLVNNAWNDLAFKRRVSDLTKTQKSVFEHIYVKEIKGELKYENLILINDIASEDGRAYLTKVAFFDHHAEITMFISFNQAYHFSRYRIEIIDQKPYLTDTYNFGDGLWFSERIKNFVNLSTRYSANSPERRNANKALNYANEMLRKGDTLTALESLQTIPASYWIGNGLSFKRLDLSATLGESMYQSVLESEFSENKSLYMKYLYHDFFGNTEELSNIYEILVDKTESKLLDSLVASGAMWR